MTPQTCIFLPSPLVVEGPEFPRISADFGISRRSCVTGSSPVTHPKKTPEIPRISGVFPFHAYICAYIPVNLAVGTSHKGAPHLLSQAGAMTGKRGSDMTTVRDEARAALAEWDDRPFHVTESMAQERVVVALRALLDEPFTDAQVEAAYEAFWERNPSSPDGRDAMRNALEAARDAS